MSTLKIKPELLHVLADIQIDNFTVAELTQSYLSRPESLHKGKKKPARQFVYRNMLRMIKAGLMEKLPNDGSWPRYRLTKMLQVKEQNPTSAESSAPHKPSPSPTNLLKSENPEKTLIERLSKRRSDMLCALGEAEEYQALCKEVPELCNEAQTLYNEARERSTLLLGKIKALESLLSHQAR